MSNRGAGGAGGAGGGGGGGGEGEEDEGEGEGEEDAEEGAGGGAGPPSPVPKVRRWRAQEGREEWGCGETAKKWWRRRTTVRCTPSSQCPAWGPAGRTAPQPLPPSGGPRCTSRHSSEHIAWLTARSYNSSLQGTASLPEDTEAQGAAVSSQRAHSGEKLGCQLSQCGHRACAPVS